MLDWTPTPLSGLHFWQGNFWGLACLPLLAWCLAAANPPAPAEERTVVEWQTEQHFDFGEIPVGRAVIHVFRFKNTSPDTILLQTVRTTCGCTAARYPEEPIAPGAIGDITVEYDAATGGPFEKKIRVFFDRQRKPEFLWIQGDVH